jgi:recombinational DNA repair protein RecT
MTENFSPILVTAEMAQCKESQGICNKLGYCYLSKMLIHQANKGQFANKEGRTDQVGPFWTYWQWMANKRIMKERSQKCLVSTKFRKQLEEIHKQKIQNSEFTNPGT